MTRSDPMAVSFGEVNGNDERPSLLLKQPAEAPLNLSENRYFSTCFRAFSQVVFGFA